MKKILCLLLLLLAVGLLAACDGTGEPEISVSEDGYLIIDGVKTEQKVEDLTHTYGEWVLYRGGDGDCEERFYQRSCSHCDSVEWKKGAYGDHTFLTATTAPTCFYLVLEERWCRFQMHPDYFVAI